MSGLVETISEIAIDVYRELGPGHAEAPYQKAMEVGLRLRGVMFEAQKVVEIQYAGYYVGDCNLDLLVGREVAVELKAIAQTVGAPERQQLRKYMSLLGATSGMLVNFAQASRAKATEGLPVSGPEIVVISTGGEVEDK